MYLERKKNPCTIHVLIFFIGCRDENRTKDESGCAGCDEISKPVGFVSKKFLNFCGSSFSNGDRKPMLERQ